MNEPRDELRELWEGGGSPQVDIEGVLKTMENKSTEFERIISRRDLREIIFGAAGAIAFGYLAYRSADLLTRVSYAWIAASFLWIIYWLRRNSYLHRSPARDQSVGAYYRALFESYEQQVWLLRTAKLWYVLPIWSGLMLFAFATWRVQHNIGVLLTLLITFNVTFGFVWWLNQSWGVRYLRRKQEELAKLGRAGE